MLVTEKFDIINIRKLRIFIVVLVEDSFAPVLLCGSKLWDQFQGGWLLLVFQISLIAVKNSKCPEWTNNVMYGFYDIIFCLIQYTLYHWHACCYFHA